MLDYSAGSGAKRRIHQDGGGLDFGGQNIVQKLSVGIKSFKVEEGSE
jgi:hypothetical protein